MNNLPETIFGVKMHYYPTHSIEECREHAENFVVLFANTDTFLRVTKHNPTKYKPKGIIVAWFDGGEINGYGTFGEDFEEEYGYKNDFEPYTFFVYHEKAKVL